MHNTQPTGDGGKIPRMAIDPQHFEETDELKPWHRQRALDSKNIMRWETVNAYALFQKYLDLGEKRSYVKVAKEVGKSQTYVERVARRWRWQERATAYFAMVNDKETEAFIGERKSMARRQAQLGVLGQNIAATGLIQIQNDLAAAGQQRPLKVHKIARLMDVSAKLERINRGEK
jgi:hypothetical protein